jgi:hypothetical protein
MSIKTSILVNLTGNLERQAKRYTKSLQGMGAKGGRALNRLSASASRGLNSIGNKYTAFFAGAGAVATVRMVGNLERRFTRLGIQSQKSEGAMEALKQKIFETARAPDIRVDSGEITSAIESIVEKTGDLKFAEDNIRNIGLAIQATGAQGGAIGEILAEFQKMGITAPAEVLKALDTMNVQGKEGAFTLENLAALGPRVITAYTSMGRTGTGALREMGAALQVIRQGTGSSEMAATAFEAVLRSISDSKKIKQLKKLGVEVQDSTGGFRAINDIMVDIIKNTGGDKIKLGKVFDAEAVRAFNAAASEFKRTGSLGSLNKFMSVFADGTTTINDSARAARDFNAVLTSLNTGWQEFADKRLSKPLGAVADTINYTNSKQGEHEIGGAIATALAFFGNEEATAALKRDNKLGAVKGLEDGLKQMFLPQVYGAYDYGAEQKSSVTIKIESDKPVSVSSLKSSNKNNVLNVDTGATMVTN